MATSNSRISIEGELQPDLKQLFIDCGLCESLNCNTAGCGCHMKVSAKETRVERVKGKISLLKDA